MKLTLLKKLTLPILLSIYLVTKSLPEIKRGFWPPVDKYPCMPPLPPTTPSATRWSSGWSSSGWSCRGSRPTTRTPSRRSSATRPSGRWRRNHEGHISAAAKRALRSWKRLLVRWSCCEALPDLLLCAFVKKNASPLDQNRSLLRRKRSFSVQEISRRWLATCYPVFQQCPCPCPVFQKKHQAIRGVVCACWIYDVKIVQSSIFVCRASPFCVHAIDNNWLFYSKGLFKLHQKRDDRAFWRSSQTKLTTSLIARAADRWWWEDTGRGTDTSETLTATSTSLTRTSLSCEPLPTLTTGWAFPLCWEYQFSWCHQAAQSQDRRVGQHFPLATRLVFFRLGYCDCFVVETLPVMVDALDMWSWWTWGMRRDFNLAIYHPV